VFVGDSPNDAPMFEFFEKIGGRGECAALCGGLSHEPKYVTLAGSEAASPSWATTCCGKRSGAVARRSLVACLSCDRLPRGIRRRNARNRRRRGHGADAGVRVQHAEMPAEHRLHVALGTAMATIIFTSLSSVRAHHAYGSVDWPIARAIAPGSWQDPLQPR